MSIGKEKQYLPVFVGSTYEDLKDYRNEVQNVLHRLETVVKGMEFFGSTPNTPLEECLKKVSESKIYIGIFGMRYGSLEDETGKSFTQLEYEEAKRLGIPILIYIIDERNQPILPVYVDTGEKAEKLKDLKNELQKLYTVSYFTTPADLAKKVSNDLPVIIEDITQKKIEKTHLSSDVDDFVLYKRFMSRPQKYTGNEISLKINVIEGIYPLSHYFAEAFGLKEGSAIFIQGYVYNNDNVLESSTKLSFILDGEIADWCEFQNPHGDYLIKIRLLYGMVMTSKSTENGTILVKEGQRQFEIIEIPNKVE